MGGGRGASQAMAGSLHPHMTKLLPFSQYSRTGFRAGKGASCCAVAVVGVGVAAWCLSLTLSTRLRSRAVGSVSLAVQLAIKRNLGSGAVYTQTRPCVHPEWECELPPTPFYYYLTWPGSVCCMARAPTAGSGG